MTALSLSLSIYEISEKQIPLGLFDQAPVLLRLINMLAKYLYVVFLGCPIIYLISSIDLLSETTYIYTFK